MNPYVPKPGIVEGIRWETERIRTFVIRFSGWTIDFKPGQFTQVLVPGVGEAPFCIASRPSVKDRVKITVQKRGNVTQALHNLKNGDAVGLRGPLGTGFPIEEFKGRELVIVGTGIGIAALRSLIYLAVEQPNYFSHVTVVYGTRYPQDLIYAYEYDEWRTAVDLIITLSRAPPEWRGHRGRVTEHLKKMSFSQDTVAAVCGSGVVMRSVSKLLIEKGVKPENIYVSLERHMKCGIGKCARCMISPGLYVCKNGPVFNLKQISLEYIARW
ncbi:MAG: hypothetical protein DRJ63_04455 [Thermoprotei archaeon]|nr:MAG: hypothetical protein DRJ63_04455 [Thermoprotei archaeon]